LLWYSGKEDLLDKEQVAVLYALEGPHPMYILKERRSPVLEHCPRIRLIDIYILSQSAFDALEERIYRINEGLDAQDLFDNPIRKPKVIQFPTRSLPT
jgi:hypothetical protein